MASYFYAKLLPDYGDLDNKCGNNPGYRVYVCENDGGIGLEMIHASLDPVREMGVAVFLTVNEAEEFKKSLEEAIERAKPKHANHRNRGVDC